MTIRHLICNKCSDFVFSFSRHDFSTCKCGACSLDGGMDYYRIIGNKSDYIMVESDLSVAIETIRDKFTWTQSFDRNGVQLKTKKTKKLKRLTTDHIVGILLHFAKKLEGVFDDTGLLEINLQWLLYHEIFLEELKFRKLK